MTSFTSLARLVTEPRIVRLLRSRPSRGRDEEEEKRLKNPRELLNKNFRYSVGNRSGPHPLRPTGSNGHNARRRQTRHYVLSEKTTPGDSLLPDDEFYSSPKTKAERRMIPWLTSSSVQREARAETPGTRWHERSMTDMGFVSTFMGRFMANYRRTQSGIVGRRFDTPKSLNHNFHLRCCRFDNAIRDYETLSGLSPTEPILKSLAISGQRLSGSLPGQRPELTSPYPRCSPSRRSLRPVTGSVAHVRRAAPCRAVPCRRVVYHLFLFQNSSRGKTIAPG